MRTEHGCSQCGADFELRSYSHCIDHQIPVIPPVRIPARPPMPDFLCWGPNAIPTAAEYIECFRLCKEIPGHPEECDIDEDGGVRCWRHDRQNESAERIVRMQERAVS